MWLKPQIEGCFEDIVVCCFKFHCVKDCTRGNECSLSKKMEVVNSSVGILQSKEVSGEKWILTRLIEVSDRHKYGRNVG